MFLPRRAARPFAALTVSLLAALAGCSATTTSPSAANPATLVSGNWQIAPSTTSLPTFSGEFSGTSAALNAILHPNSASACVPTGSIFQLSGSINDSNQVSLSGTSAQGGKLTVSGTLSADGRSLSNASYQLVGATCNVAVQTAATAQAYSPITGSYTGTFTDATNTPVVTISATLTQTPASDPNGNFQLSGTASFGTNPCFSSPVSIASSQVTGGSFTLTYADSNTHNSVTATGTFAPSGMTLSVTQWSLTGPCGPDSGTGTLSR